MSAEQFVDAEIEGYKVSAEQFVDAEKDMR